MTFCLALYALAAVTVWLLVWVLDDTSGRITWYGITLFALIWPTLPFLMLYNIALESWRHRKKSR